MKQYKLKQKYPSLPSDWEVGMEVGQGDRGSCGDYSPIHGKYSNRYINACEVHNNSEFWEEVVEKIKDPIFQSFDGESIYSGQPYYAVTKDFQLAYCSFYSEHDLDMKLFAKKDNAEEYIKTYKNYKTTDGERIVEGHTFYVYEDKFFKCIKTSFGNFTSDKWAEKRFKTEEEVKELILMNKPCLSINDIKKFSNATVYEIVANNLKEFAKNKIKNGI